jgi:hypothetical protein
MGFNCPAINIDFLMIEFHVAFQITAINNIAKNILQQHKIDKNKILTEQQYVSFLYKLKNIKLTKEEEKLIKFLNNKLPE